MLLGSPRMKQGGLHLVKPAMGLEVRMEGLRGRASNNTMSTSTSTTMNTITMRNNTMNTSTMSNMMNTSTTSNNTMNTSTTSINIKNISTMNISIMNIIMNIQGNCKGQAFSELIHHYTVYYI